jgi:hypothetical protein
MENQRLQHRIRELRALKAPFMQPGPSTSTASTLPSNFGGNPSSTTSSLPVQLQAPVDPSPTVPDHTESTAANPSPVTRNFDAAGFQEGEQDEPAKKKVRGFRCSDPVDIIGILDQETSPIDLSTGLRDVWENGLAGVEKGPSSLQTVT